jgi:hypothetical protein
MSSEIKDFGNACPPWARPLLFPTGDFGTSQFAAPTYNIRWATFEKGVRWRLIALFGSLARLLSAVIAGVIAESGHNRLRVDHDRDDGAGRQNEGDGRKSNELVHNRLLSKSAAIAGSSITVTASRKT